MTPVHHIVVRNHEGQRLDNFLIRELKRVPRSRIMRMIRTGEVRVNGKRAQVSTKLQTNDRIRIPPVSQPEVHQPRASKGLMAEISQRILFEDDRWLVINKPPGLAVHAGGTIDIGLIEAARQLYTNDDLELAHRLDQGTSGCVVLAKTRVALLELHHAFQHHRIQKTYDAIVIGRWPASVDQISAPLRRYTLPNGERRVEVSSDGKVAATLFSVARQCAVATWLKVEPRTGRTHQIRVHCFIQGCPVVGDTKYRISAALPFKPTRMMLHASKLQFADGFEIFAPLSEEFEQVWLKLSSAD